MNIEQLQNFFKKVYEEPKDKYIQCLYYPVLEALVNKSGRSDRDEIISFINKKYNYKGNDWKRGTLSLDHLFSQRFGKGEEQYFLNELFEHDGVNAGDKKTKYKLKDTELIRKFVDSGFCKTESIKEQMDKRIRYLSPNKILSDDELKNIAISSAIKVKKNKDWTTDLSKQIEKYSSPEVDLTNTDNLLDLFNSDAVCATGQANSTPIINALNDEEFRKLFSEKINKLKTKDHRYWEDYKKLYDELIEELRQRCGKQPKLKLSRALCALFPENVSVIGNFSTLKHLHDSIFDDKSEHPVEMHFKVFKKLNDLLGPIDKSNTQEFVERMILPWQIESDINEMTINNTKEESFTKTDEKKYLNPPLNQILYGPPGTGKTFATIDETLRILDPLFLNDHLENRIKLKARFDELLNADHVSFVTFHQSFSYEDFVEGLRAQSDDNGQLSYYIQDGVFKNLCITAAAKVIKQAEAPIDLVGRRIWKMSLGNTLGVDSYIYEECINNGYILLGYGDLIDFSNCKDRNQIYDQFIASGYTLTKDAYAVIAVNSFLQMAIGDLIVVTDGNTKFRAIGEVTGGYRNLSREEKGDDYGQCREVKWLRVYKPSLPYTQLMNNQFVQKTLYELHDGSIDRRLLAEILQTQTTFSSERNLFQKGDAFGSYKVINVSSELLEIEKPNGNILPISMAILHTLTKHVKSEQITIEDIKNKNVFNKIDDPTLEPYLVNGYNNIYSTLVDHILNKQSDKLPSHTPSSEHPNSKVLIIDEINRGNISRIFGELITLIEPSKRAGAKEALSVTLPYSKKPFYVPDNIYLIGTMNTADRSLAGLDIALRRRFTFKEMAPKPELLDNIYVESVIDIGQLLRKMNERIEVLLDRDHCLGHAYFMTFTEANPKKVYRLDDLAFIFRQQILPLLQEYFFEDWERISWVLNDQQKKDTKNRFLIRPKTDLIKLFGAEEAGKLLDGRWQINNEAFDRIDAYLGIINHEAEAITSEIINDSSMLDAIQADE